MCFFSIHRFSLRHAEFARSVCKTKLGNPSSPLHYMGLLRETQKDVSEFIEEAVYLAWDASPVAPPKTRPREAAQEPSLGTLLWQNSRPVFPPSLVSKFSDQPDCNKKILAMKSEVETLWPSTEVPGSDATTVPRAVGAPDFAGEDVLDVNREVDLKMTHYNDFAEDVFPCCRFMLAGHFFVVCSMVEFKLCFLIVRYLVGNWRKLATQ